MSRRHVVGRAADLRPGDRMIVEVARRSVGIFNVKGAFYALRNRCPHQGAPLAEGVVSGTCLPSTPGEYVYAREGEILRCPWHAWEFDLTNGRSIHNPHRCRVRSYEVREADERDGRVDTYEVRVEAGDLILYL